MNLESIKNRKLSAKMEERLLYMYRAHNLGIIPKKWPVFPPQMIALHRREMIDSVHTIINHKEHSFSWTVNEKGINYLKSKGLI